MGFRYEELDGPIKARIDAALRAQKPRNNNTPPAADVEPNPVAAAAKENAVEAFDSQVSIVIHSVRRRRTDADGVSAKWAIDALVACGVIKDDGPDYVRSVMFTQEQGKPEKTIIKITC